MSGNKIFIDTNIALYLLKGDQELGGTLQNSETFVSFITELELLGFKGITSNEESHIALFLSECIILDVNQGIKSIAIDLRRKYALKLPDTLVAATAIFLGIPLFSADKHFSQITELTFVLYKP